MNKVVFEATAQMPLLFIGHGSPMNAIEENQFVKGWRDAVQSIPTPEHYNPLLYILGLKEENEEIEFFNDELVMGSISMTSIFIFGHQFNPLSP